MTPKTAKLATALLKLYFEGRPHGNIYGANGSITCHCHKCQAWDAVEKFSQSDFDELESELNLMRAGAPAMEILKKCVEMDIVEINKGEGFWKVRGLTMPGASARAETLEEAIALFARKLADKK